MASTINKNKNNYKKNKTSLRPFRLHEDESSIGDLRIELLPLIDVIFCILTFFLLAAVNFSRQQAITLDLPQAQTSQPQMRDMLVVTIDEIGQVYVEKRLVTRNVLKAYIKDYNKTNPNGLMVLYAAKNSTYREVVEVLDMLREVGGNRVALATVPTGIQEETNTPQLNPFTIPNPPNPPK